VKQSVLRGTDDYQDWEKLIAHCDEIEDLQEAERANAKEAFRFLRTEFGNSFLKRAFVTGNPIMRMIINTAPWTRKGISDFAQSIKDAKTADPEGFKKLIDQFQSAPKCNPAISVLNIGNAFLNSGFSIAFEPKAEIFTKIPDLKYEIGCQARLAPIPNVKEISANLA
jgi:hypothetical protein